MQLSDRLPTGPPDRVAEDRLTRRAPSSSSGAELEPLRRLPRNRALTLLLAAAVHLGSCGDSRSPTPPTPPNGGNSGCGLGPVPIVTTGPEPCTTVVPACPTPRPTGARDLVWIGTCSFIGRDGGCQPIQLPACPRDTRIVSLLLANLGGAGRGCAAAGELTLDARATGDGDLHLLWRAEEFDPVTCRPSGVEQKGEVSLAGPCCGRILDVYLPRYDQTMRVDLRSDWQR
jgi:hypothetical protein